MERVLLNRGVLFPIHLEGSDVKGWYPTYDVEALIDNNIEAIMVHEIGQRLNQEDFGTKLWSCIEEPNTQALGFLVNQFVKEAITKYESRIIYQGSKVMRRDSTLYILVQYKLKQTGIDQSVIVSYNF